MAAEEEEEVDMESEKSSEAEETEAWCVHFAHFFMRVLLMDL